MLFLLFFFTDPSTTDIYTLSLHDALPIWSLLSTNYPDHHVAGNGPNAYFQLSGTSMATGVVSGADRDRKSTRLNSSHRCISYAVFCLKKKKKRTSKYI